MSRCPRPLPFGRQRGPRISFYNRPGTATPTGDIMTEEPELDDAGRVVSCPAGSDPISARAPFVIVDGRRMPSADALRAALGRREN